MKKHLYCLIFTTLAISQCFAGKLILGLSNKEKDIPTNEWGIAMDSTQISLGLKSDAKTFTTNETIEVLVRINNLSTNEPYHFYLERTFTNNSDFSFIVTSPSGNDISPIFHQAIISSGGIITVPPNQIKGFQFDLDEICKPDAIGTYKIVIKMRRWSKEENKSFEVISNPLFITFVPDN